MSWIAGLGSSVLNSQNKNSGQGMFNLTGRLTQASKGNSRSKGGAVYDTFLGGGLGLFSDGGIFGGKGKGDEDMNLEDLLVYKQLPDYAETDVARGQWGDKLTQWGQDPNYGAIPMNWDEIWNTAKDKLNRYYWGGVNDTGLAGKVKASAARRGVSQSPALENQLATLGFQQGIDMNALATEEATNKAKFAESGRNTWLNSLMNLSSLKPQFITSAGAVGPAVSAMYGDAQEGDSGTASILGSLGSLFGNMGNQNQNTGSTGNSGWLNNLLQQNVYGNSQNSLVSNQNSGSMLTDYFNKNYSGYN